MMNVTKLSIFVLIRLWKDDSYNDVAKINNVTNELNYDDEYKS